MLILQFVLRNIKELCGRQDLAALWKSLLVTRILLATKPTYYALFKCGRQDLNLRKHKLQPLKGCPFDRTPALPHKNMNYFGVISFVVKGKEIGNRE